MSIKLRKRAGCKGWLVDLHVELPDGNRTRFRKVIDVPTKERAVRWAEEKHALLLTEYRREKPAAVVEKHVPTLREFEADFLAKFCEAERQKRSGIEAKRSAFRCYLVPHLGDRRLDQIGNEDVAKLKAAMAAEDENGESLSSKTVNNALSVLSKALKVAESWGIIDRLPCRIGLLHYQPPEMKFYDFAQYSKLVEAAGKLSGSHLVTVRLGGDAGLRSGEMTGLEWPDIDFDRGFITIQRAEWEGKVDLPKGGRSRRVPMTLALQKALRDHRPATQLRGKRVLVAPEGGSATQEVLRVWVAAAQVRAVLAEVTDGVAGGLHILRHTFCSHLAMRGAPAMAIKELAGHADLKTTQRYMHLSPSTVESAIRLLDAHGPMAAQRKKEGLSS